MPRKKRRVQNWTPIDEAPAPPPVVIKPAEAKKTQLRVAAYCRVSTDHLEQESSIESQMAYYTSLIQSNPEWRFAGIYKDILSGTKSDRPGLQAMLNDCRAGKIDRIICKSISRLARDTLITLQVVKELRDLGISILFEKENIDTSTFSSEIFLSCFSSFAEMEAQSISDNVKWAIRKRFEAGTYVYSTLPYGYKYNSTPDHEEHNSTLDHDEKSSDQKTIAIDPVKAKVVRRIFSLALEGIAVCEIATTLNAEGIPGPKGTEWKECTIQKMLHMEFYKGNVLYGKNSNVHFKCKKNEGQKFFHKDHHKAIVSAKNWDRVQDVLAEKAQMHRMPDTDMTIS